MSSNTFSEPKYPRKDIPGLMLKWSLSGWWGIISGICFPLLFGLGMLLLYSRLQPIIETAGTPEEHFVALVEDMIENPVLYIIFVLMFITWIVPKTIREKSDMREKRRMNDILERIENKLDKLNQRGAQNGESNSNIQSNL